MYIKAIFLSLLFIGIQGMANHWGVDLDKALEQAGKDHKYLLVAFLGPDWCTASDQLEENVLTKGDFTRPLSEKMLFVRINIPETSESLGEWQEKFQVTKCPSLILLRSSGEKIAHLETRSMKAPEYARYIEQVVSDFHQVEELSTKKNLKKCSVADLKTLYAKAQKLADGRFQKTLLEEGVKSDRSPYFLLEQYGQMLASQSDDKILLRRLRNKIVARDPQNSQGYQREVAVLDFLALSKGQKAKKVSTVVKPLIDYLKKFGHEDAEHAWELEMKLSKYYFSHNDNKEALKHACASLRLAPKEAKDEVAQSIEYLQTHMP